jgi:hypothetical protein
MQLQLFLVYLAFGAAIAGPVRRQFGILEPGRCYDGGPYDYCYNYLDLSPDICQQGKAYCVPPVAGNGDFMYIVRMT